MYKFSQKSLEKINNPLFHSKLRLLLTEAIQNSPLDFTVIETVRTKEKQQDYYKKGVSKTLKSRHIPECNKSGMCEAFDIAPYPVDWQNLEQFKLLAAHIKKTADKLNINIQWGGDWKTFIDMPHFELKRK